MKRFFALILLFAPAAAQACAVCTGVAGTAAQRAYFWGILLLLCLPFALFSIIGGKIFLSIRKKARETHTGTHAS